MITGLLGSQANSTHTLATVATRPLSISVLAFELWLLHTCLPAVPLFQI